VVVYRVVLSGRVQGVGFRAWIERTARSLGLSGWVRNRRDGSVEALFAGSAAVVDDMISRCRRGPDHARVEVLERHEESEAPLPGFQIRATV
jgi:acylphosphatase